MAGRLGAEEIYASARLAGFSPDQAVTMTAISLAESGGNPGAHNSQGEDSKGLWQINMDAHRNSAWAQGLDMHDPLDGAKAAWEVSGHGSNISPWTVTHGDRGSPYAQYADEARAAAAAFGESGMGSFDGPANYSDDSVTAGVPGNVPFDPGALTLGGSAPGAIDPVEPVEPAGESQVELFLRAALNQAGDDYIMYADTDPNDPDPDAFDCSELVEWAAAQAGVSGVGEASYIQYLDMKAAGTLISVEDALQTPGALLFRFPSEPVPGAERQDGSHVAISLGDGRTIEAKNSDDDVGIFEGAADRGFNYAALIPGMDYNGAQIPSLDPVEPAVVVDEGPTDLEIALWNANSGDEDADMLADHYEVKYGLDPKDPDTDGDGITDGYELIVLGTDADLADSDFDRIADGLELALGLDPLVADNPDPTVGPYVPPDELAGDTDGDGLTDWGEEWLGTDPLKPDTDGDGVLDGDEQAMEGDPLVADST